ncbi:hypothetical protein SAMN05421848_1001 [Kushneria avicenniae]|uniref:Uncharacterized protein n=1 Tax=Kushneria avicenniae TaxID=402385 RepID=A0A1I1IAI6_9GAMM|nr:hypothetical protein [Kushneria avicenniae]SFC31268.1 hypothetical protein SAMN05421848_1001 [Kushneria avicenniae]
MPYVSGKQCVSGVHQLLGSTLKDARRERQGRIVGIDQTREHPVIDVIWQGQPRAERIIITCDQLRDLVRASISRAAAQTQKAAPKEVQTGSDDHATAELAEQRRA